MKKLIFAAVAACSLIVNLSGSAQVVIKTYAEASMAQPSLMLDLDSIAYLSINYAEKDSCEIFRISGGVFTSIFKSAGQTSIADFHVFSADTLYGPVGEHLYAIALDGSGHKVLSDNFDMPLLISGENLLISTGEVVEGNYLQHMLMRDIESGSVDTVYSYFSQALPITQHIGVVGDYLYFSIPRYPEEKSTVLRYGLVSGTLDTLTTEGTISFGVGFGDKFAYSTDNGDGTVEVILVSSNTTINIILDRKEYFDFLILSQGPNGEFLVNSQENLFIWDGIGDIQSWNYGHEPNSINWKGRYVSSSYDEEFIQMTYGIFVGDTEYQLFQLDSLDMQFVISKDNKLYIRKPVNDWTETQIIMYDLCGNGHILQGVTNETSYKAGKAWKSHQKVEGSVLYEPSGSLLLLPGFEADASQGDIFEARIWTGGCPNNN